MSQSAACETANYETVVKDSEENVLTVVVEDNIENHPYDNDEDIEQGVQIIEISNEDIEENGRMMTVNVTSSSNVTTELNATERKQTVTFDEAISEDNREVCEQDINIIQTPELETASEIINEDIEDNLHMISVGAEAS